MKTKDESLTEIVVLTMIGRTALPIGLRHEWVATAACAVGFAASALKGWF